jgi:hypothetical protein
MAASTRSECVVREADWNNLDRLVMFLDPFNIMNP